MSDGGYSRIEKDFLGNERMVHYDGSGNMIGASDVVREPDGTIRIPNEPMKAVEGLPDVQAVEPKPKPQASPGVPHLPLDAGKTMARNKQMSMSQTVTWAIGSFVGALILTVAAMMIYKSMGHNGRAYEQFPATTSSSPSMIQNPRNDSPPMPDQSQDRYPSDPKPRNDEPSQDAKPYDQTAPDMNSGDDNRPKIDSGDNDPAKKSDTETAPKTDDKKGSSSDPIDLRGDSDPKKGPSKSDPNDIH